MSDNIEVTENTVTAQVTENTTEVTAALQNINVILDPLLVEVMPSANQTQLIVTVAVGGGSTGGSPNVILTDVPCDPSVAVGDVVRMSSGVAVQALADSFANSNSIGIIESKASTTLCNIRVLGTTGEIFTGLDETMEYYLSDTVPGAMTTTPPTATGSIYLKIGQPFSSTRLLVLKGERIERA